MNTFEKHKADFLSKTDKSKKGSIDKPIRKLVDAINGLDNYYTTSSCSGRIVLLHKAGLGKNTNKKNTVKWLLVSHEPISLQALKNAIAKIPKQGEVWLLCESLILHVASRSLDDAISLMKLFQQSGLKRSALISATKNKAMVEIIGNDRIEMPISLEGELLASGPALSFLVEDSNAKLTRQFERISILEKTIADNFG